MNEKARILVIDDDPTMLQVTGRILSNYGYETIQAANGFEGLRLARKYVPDLALVDVNMPEMDGYEVCRNIKLDDQLANTYVVLISGFTTDSDGQSLGLEIGADGYIARPIPRRELLARVESLLRLKSAEKALKASEERFRLLFQNHDAVMLLIEPDSGAIVDANHAAVAYYGYPRDTICMMNISEINCLDSDKILAETAWGKQNDRSSFILSQRLASGDIRTVEAHISPIDVQGRTLLFSILHDVSARVLAERLLAESQEQLALSIEGSGIGLWDWKIGTGEMIFNERWAQIIGYSLEELVPTDVNTWQKFFHPDDLRKSDESLRTHFLGDTVYECEVRMKHKDGHWVWAVNRGSVSEWDENGAPVRMTGTLLDITDRKRIENDLAKALDVIRSQKSDIEKTLDQVNSELLHSERRFKILFETAQDFMFIKDKDLRYVDVNKAALGMLQMDRQDIIGKTDRELFDRTLSDSREDIETRVLKGQTIESQERFMWKSQDIELNFIRFPFQTATGEPGGVCGIARELFIPSATPSNYLPMPNEFPSEAARSTFAEADLAAKTNTTILLTGETGSGKDFFARYVHDSSSRSTGPYFSINCAAIPQDIAESELFGHDTGAFTGAIRRKRGLIELAEGGTLLLNEVGELSLNLQSKLLTFLDTHSFTRIGGEADISVNLRLIAATSKDLWNEVCSGVFRKDLFYRLSVFPIRVPPLRERLEDIPVMVDNILKGLSVELQYNRVPRISQGAVEALALYGWPGNVRELKNVLERAIILSRGSEIRSHHLRLGQGTGTGALKGACIEPGKSFRGIIEGMERSLIEEALRCSNGKKQRAAHLLGMSRTALRRHIAKLEIKSE